MGHPSVISRTPLLRVLAPYVAGILLYEVCPRWWPPLALIALAVIGGWVLGRISSATPSRRLLMRPYLALPLLAVALALGWLAAVIHHPPVLDAELRHSGNRVGQILDLDHTDFSTRLTVRLLDVPSATMPCRVLVTTRGCDYTLSPGDVITWPADLEPISSRGNPEEMDYVSYMLHDQGIRYCQHLPGRDVQVLGRSPSLSTRMAALRRGLASNVYATSLSDEAQRLVVTLLLGQRGAIDPETRQQFSTAGVAHVLALSGLHVGLVALMLWWLLFPLDYIGLRRLRLAAFRPLQRIAAGGTCHSGMVTIGDFRCGIPTQFCDRGLIVAGKQVASGGYPHALSMGQLPHIAGRRIVDRSAGYPGADGSLLPHCFDPVGGH